MPDWADAQPELEWVDFRSEYGEVRRVRRSQCENASKPRRRAQQRGAMPRKFRLIAAIVELQQERLGGGGVRGGLPGKQRSGVVEGAPQLVAFKVSQ